MPSLQRVGRCVADDSPALDDVSLVTRMTAVSPMVEVSWLLSSLPELGVIYPNWLLVTVCISLYKTNKGSGSMKSQSHQRV